MYINQNMVQKMARQKGLSLQALLETAGVSPNAYYTLARKQQVIPKSLVKIAEILELPVSELLIDEQAAITQHQETYEQARTLVNQDPSLDINTVRLTLEFLKDTPLERLSRGLQFGDIKNN